MTPEQRLKQVEILLETAAKSLNKHSQNIAQLEEQNLRMNSQMSQLVDLFSELSQYSRQNQEQIQEHRQEMRQFREEMRQFRQEVQRIWEYLLSQTGNGKGNN